MNNEIEVGEYVRTKSGFIGKIVTRKGGYGLRYQLDIDKEIQDNWINGWVHEDNIVNHSKNKVELVEAGDYVNGWKVLAKTKIKNNEMQVCILTCFEDEHWITINNETLKTIVTKESFKEREYVF